MSISPKMMMFFTALLVLGKIISMGTEGEFWDGDRYDEIYQSFTGYSVDELSGLGGVVVGASGFFATGLPQMLLWDYAFLDYPDLATLDFILTLIRIFLVVTVSAGFIWGIVSQFQSYMIPALIGTGLIWGIGSLF